MFVNADPSPGDRVEGEVEVEVTDVMELEVGEDTESCGDNRELSEDNLDRTKSDSDN